MRLYMIRHGETPWNIQLRLQGQSDVALNEKGRALARMTAEALHQVPFDLAISSPLSRAVETAQIIIGDRNIPLFLENRIREISFGEMEGRQMSREEREDPSSAFYHFFHAPDHYQPAMGGETIDALCSRTGAFLDELKMKREWAQKTILISSHGAAVRSLLSNIKGTSRKNFWENGVPKNCAVSIVDLEDEKWIVREQDVVYYENF